MSMGSSAYQTVPGVNESKHGVIFLPVALVGGNFLSWVYTKHFILNIFHSTDGLKKNPQKNRQIHTRSVDAVKLPVTLLYSDSVAFPRQYTD